MIRLRLYLKPTQLQRLKEHKYAAKGSSLSEVFMQPFWRWLVTKIPLWVAPNLLTFIGLVVNIATSLPVIILDYNAEGKAPWWCYLACAIGFFFYQSLDAIDGKQARRTGTNSPLGELFDHGCDAIATIIVLLTGISAIGLHEHTYLMLLFVVLLEVLNYLYHWQTYVCGVLHFKNIDVTEAQFLHIALLVTTATFGVEIWQLKLPWFNISLKIVLAIVVIGSSVFNLLQALYIILTGGVGKNGSTVADTSVLSPAVALFLQVPVIILYALHSPDHLLETQCMLLFVAIVLPMSKSIITLLIATMTKSPFPLSDPIMIGPLLAYLNIYAGTPIPELYFITIVAAYNVADILLMCISLCQQICDFLQIYCFSITLPMEK